jgi:hypothetical protein
MAGTEEFTVQRVAELERLLGVHQRHRAEWVESLGLDDEYLDEATRVRRLRRLRGELFADLAESPGDGEAEWRLGVVDRLIRANVNTHAPEKRLDALEGEYAYLMGQAAMRPPDPAKSHLQGMGWHSPEEHAQRVAKANERLPQVAAQIEQVKAELAHLYGQDTQ